MTPVRISSPSSTKCGKNIIVACKPPVAPVVETAAVELIEQPAPITVTEVEETRKAS
jgi:hypothetical protein